METFHLFLNLLCLLLWFDWRTSRISSANPPKAASLSGALNHAAGSTSKRGGSLWLLLAILFLRPILYNALTHGATWTPVLELQIISLPWRSDDAWRMLLYSWISFGQLLLYAHVWMIALVRINHLRGEDNSVHRILHAQLGSLLRLPLAFRLALPALVVFLFWLFGSPLFVRLGITPEPKSIFHLLGQSFLLGAWQLLVYRWLLIGLLAFHMVELFVFLGDSRWLRYPRLSAKSLSSRFHGMRLVVGKVDLTDLILILAIYFGSEALVSLGTDLFLGLGL